MSMQALIKTAVNLMISNTEHGEAMEESVSPTVLSRRIGADKDAGADIAKDAEIDKILDSTKGYN